MIWLIILVISLLYFWWQEERNNTNIRKFKTDKIRELEIKIMGLEKHARKIQDTLDHYGMRMSNKVPDENKYYKRWKK